MKNKFFDFTKEVFAGKSIGRILFNWQVQKHCQDLSGLCLDLAAGDSPSYIRYWSLAPGAKLITADYDKSKNPDLIIPFDEKMPLEDNSIDNLFLFNAIYIAKKPEELVREIHRVLKPNGRFFLTAPLIANEAPEPNDYFRFTSQGIKMILSQAGFSQVELYKIGERATSAATLLHSSFLFNFVRFFVFGLALFLDKIIPKKTRKKYPCPMSYFVIAKK